ncbi:hypothetical protein FRC07_014165 [Ceratobasidium sp. 392]|nr:hypothetical protein FRC07_014165 [Ceratobasidium sp. 392]
MRYAYTRTGTLDVETEANTYKEVPGWISSGYRYDPHLGAFGLPSRLANGATYSSTVFRDQLQLNTSPGLLEVSQQTSLTQSATSPPPYQRGYPRQSDVLLDQPARPHAELRVDNAAEGSFSRIRDHGQYVLPTAPSWATVWLTNNRQTRRDRVPSFRDEDVGDDLDGSFSSEDYEGAKPPMNNNCESQDTLGAGFTERTPGLSKLTTHSNSFTIPTLAPAPRHSFTVPEQARFLPQPISQSPPPIHAVHAVPQAVSFGPYQSGLGRSTSENLRTTTIIRPLPVLPSRDLPAP